MRKKKYNLTKEHDKNIVYRALINKMLQPYGVDYNFVIENPIINGKDWFEFYTWTEQEEEEYKLWFLKYLSTWTTPLRPAAYYLKEWGWFNLNHGLRIKENENNSNS